MFGGLGAEAALSMAKSALLKEYKENGTVSMVIQLRIPPDSSASPEALEGEIEFVRYPFVVSDKFEAARKKLVEMDGKIKTANETVYKLINSEKK